MFGICIQQGIHFKDVLNQSLPYNTQLIAEFVNGSA